MVLCAPCGGFAVKLTVPVDRAPFWRCWRTFAAAMFTREGLSQLFALAVVLHVVNLIPTVAGVVLTLFVYLSYYFHVIRRTAVGSLALPEPDDFTGFDSFSTVMGYVVAAALMALGGSSSGFSLVDVSDELPDLKRCAVRSRATAEDRMSFP